MSSNPGTVSKILWHFTGGPYWDQDTKTQGPTPKAASEAFDCLVKILESQHLRLGRYKEVVPVTQTWQRVVGPGTIDIDPSKQEIHVIESEPVVCLADIPMAHLAYHAKRYGKFAIGFARDDAIKAGFSPVHYQFSHSFALQSILDAMCAWEAAATLEPKLSAGTDHVGSIALRQADRAIKKWLSHIKVCSREELSTIFCEREWRSTNRFDFKREQIALIVLPRENGYFARLTSEAEDRSIPRSVAIVAWEDLIEH